MADSIVTRSELLVLANQCCEAAPAESGLALMMNGGDLERFAAKIAEECAITVLNEAVEIAGPTDESYNLALKHAAAAIRERGET